MISINTNLGSLIVQNNLKTSTLGLNQAIERMTTGFKINGAKDNAANFAISTQLDTKISAYNIAEENVSTGLDLVTTASDSLSQIEDKLARIRALQEQAANGTYGEDSLKAINLEVNALVDEIERIYESTEYNGIKILEFQNIVSDYQARPKANAEGFIQDVVKVETSTMTSLSSVDATQKITSGTYSISTAEELVKLAEMTNNGLIGRGTEYVLANNIDLSHISNWTPIGNQTYDHDNNAYVGYAFEGNFNGNGYVISNLKIRAEKNYVGLFGRTEYHITIKNLGLENVDVYSTGEQVGALIGAASLITLQNCYTKGSVRGAKITVGGLCGQLSGSADSCYSEASVSAIYNVGGLFGTLFGNITNSYFEGEVSSQKVASAGGIAGQVYNGDRIIDNCYVNIKGINSGGVFVGRCNNLVNSLIISNSSYSTINNPNLLVAVNDSIHTVTITDITEVPLQKKSSTILQIGINSESSAQISVDISINAGSTDLLRVMSTYGDYSKWYYQYLDDYMANISAKQTEYGAAQNRLESALEQIGVCYENLVSTRSTVKDADVAEESSEYIRNQILQQASATLLATANQTPSIALQLI